MLFEINRKFHAKAEQRNKVMDAGNTKLEDKVQSMAC